MVESGGVVGVDNSTCRAFFTESAYNLQKWRSSDGFDFIECFTTTFLRAHSWLNWVDEDDDEDEVDLKEKPEDTRYIKKDYIKIRPEAPGV